MKFFLLFLIVLSNTAFANEIPPKWKTAKKTDRVELQYRWLKFGDTLKAREMCIRFTIDADHLSIINSLKEPERVLQWSTGLQTFEIIGQSTNEWTTYSLYDIPKPLRKQDLVAKYQLNFLKDSTVVDVMAVPNEKRKYDKIKRINNYSGKWIMKQNRDGTTDVSFFSLSVSKPIIPRFILDLILQPMLINSFEEFIQITEHETDKIDQKDKKFTGHKGQACIHS